MQFSTRQVQELSGIRREQLRHWKKVLPPLSGRDGRADTYSFADVLALSTIAALVDRMGIAVSRLVVPSSDLFALIADTDANTISTMRIYVNASGVVGTLAEHPQDAVFAIVDIGQLLTELRGRLGPDQLRQLPLPLA